MAKAQVLLLVEMLPLPLVVSGALVVVSAVVLTLVAVKILPMSLAMMQTRIVVLALALSMMKILPNQTRD